MTSVTVYTPSRNYGRYLRDAVDSVMRQSLTDWELFLIDEGSSDETAAICQEYVARDPARVRFIAHDTPRGLPHLANRILEQARGKYIVRLDADDWLDDSALLVLARFLDDHPDVGMVYPNYFYVDADGRMLGVERRPRVDRGALLDLPAHGACTMVRKRVLKVVGGYDEARSAQDGWDLWLKAAHRFGASNVDSCLFFYRQHGDSLSRNEQRLLDQRAAIKQAAIARSSGNVRPRTLAVVPARNSHASLGEIALAPLAGIPLIDHTLRVATATCDEVVVTTDDARVADHATQQGINAFVRDEQLRQADRRMSEVVFDAVTRAESDHGANPDVIVTLSIHSPLRVPDDIERALHALFLFNADSVVSVYEDQDLHLSHGPSGLSPLNPGMERMLRLEREGLYVDNGAITASWRDQLTAATRFPGRVTHSVMPRERSFQIKTAFDRWLITAILGRNEPQ